MNLKINLIVSLLLITTVNQVKADNIFERNNDPDFKRYSVSVGWLHASILGKANELNIGTALSDTQEYEIGSVSSESILNAIDRSTPKGNTAYNSIKALDSLGLNSLPRFLTGTVKVSQPINWWTDGNGFEAKDIDTAGIMLKYHFNDNIAFEIKGGVPPKVNVKGVGTVYAPVIGEVNLPILSSILVGSRDVPVRQDLEISNIARPGSAVTARGWLPGFEIQYQFGKSGVNKFRPYIGTGLIYAHLSHLKIESQVESELVAAGHRVQNILDNNSGAALDGTPSQSNINVRLKTKDAIAPLLTLGFTYDFNESWFTTASLTYSNLKVDAKVDIFNSDSGQVLINAKNEIAVDPILTYVGLGYRF